MSPYQDFDDAARILANISNRHFIPRKLVQKMLDAHRLADADSKGWTVAEKSGSFGQVGRTVMGIQKKGMLPEVQEEAKQFLVCPPALQVLDLLELLGNLTVGELAGRLSVSEEMAKSFVTVSVKSGKVKKVGHGLPQKFALVKGNTFTYQYDKPRTMEELKALKRRASSVLLHSDGRSLVNRVTELSNSGFAYLADKLRSTDRPALRFLEAGDSLSDKTGMMEDTFGILTAIGPNVKDVRYHIQEAIIEMDLNQSCRFDLVPTTAKLDGDQISKFLNRDLPSVVEWVNQAIDEAERQAGEKSCYKVSMLSALLSSQA